MDTQPISAAGGKPALSFSEAVAAMSASKQEQTTEQNPISEAARTLSKRAAEARQARQAEAAQIKEPVESQEDEQEAQQTDPEATPEGEAEGATTGETEALSDGEEAKTETEPKGQPSIEVDGVTLTVEEIRKGYLRQADYTRKTQELAEKSKDYDALAVKAKAYDASITRLNELADALQAELPQEPDWVEESRNDPLGSIQKKFEWDSRQAKLQKSRELIKAEMMNLLAHQQAEAQRKLQETYWKTPQAMEAGFKAVRQYALETYGFSPQDFALIADHRVVEILDKARQWDEMQAKKPALQQKAASAPKVQKPGARVPAQSANQAQLKAAWEAFLKNPTTENGARYYQLKQAASRKQ